MTAQFEVKLREVGNTMVVSIPRPAIAGLKWKAGDKLILTVNGSVTITKSNK